MVVIYLLILLIIIILYLIFSKMEKYTEFKKFNGINSFDNVFYINLKHRTDRKKQITNELDKMKINKNKIIRINAVRNKLNGHIGCCKSHIKTLNKAKKMNLKNIIVFEDDFVFTIPKKDVDNKINYFLKKYKDWDIIQLTAGYKNLENIDDTNIKKVNSATTSSCYIIKDKFYNILLNDLNESLNKMENEMKNYLKNNPNKKKTETSYALDQHWSPLQKKSKWYIFDPYLGKQGGDAGGSSIMGNIEAFNSIKFFSLKV
jgi:glycosyl transferase, family 25